jgi:hypothetical protein
VKVIDEGSVPLLPQEAELNDVVMRTPLVNVVTAPGGDFMIIEIVIEKGTLERIFEISLNTIRTLNRVSKT